MESGNIQTKDPHLINISVYKPNALSSFWSWFSRKNKNNLTDMLEKGDQFDINLNVENLNALKMNGIDLEKLQNHRFLKSKNILYNSPAINHKNCLSKNGHIILKDTLIANLKNKENLGKNKTIYVKRIMSTSTISIKSKTNFGTRNVKYIRNITSQKSVVNSGSISYRKNRIKDHKSAESPPFNRSILLKSVPTEILKSNTQKKVFVPLHIGRKKTDKTTNKVQNSKLKDIRDREQDKKSNDPSDIPMILTKIKSMEEQLCDIGNTTKKINDVVSQNSIHRTKSLTKDINHNHQNRYSHIKGLPSHKMYSRNILQTSKKSKVSAKKFKNKSKLTIPSKFIDNNQMKFHAVSHDLNDSEALNGARNSFYNIEKSSNIKNKTFDKSKIPLKNNIVSNNTPLKENSTKVKHNEDLGMVNQNKELTIINPKIDYDFVINLLKGMSDAKGSEIGFVKPNTNNSGTTEKQKLLFNTNGLMSKATFDWKHKSLSSVNDADNENKANVKGLPDANKVIMEKEKINCDINLTNPIKDILKCTDMPVNNSHKKEFNTKTSEPVKETGIQKMSVSKPQVEIVPEVHSLVRISEKEIIKQDYSLIICRDMIQMLKEKKDFKKQKNTTTKKETERKNELSAEKNENQSLNKSQTVDGSDINDDIKECTLKRTKPNVNIHANTNETIVKELMIKKMITRATQSEPNQNDVVKVCVETPSGDKVKIENMLCGKGLKVVATSGVSLVKDPLHEKCVTIGDNKDNQNNSFILPEKSHIAANKCIVLEPTKKEDISSRAFLQHGYSVDKGTINKNDKQVHLGWINGIDKFVPAKRIESEKHDFRFPGEYMSQAKRKTYEEILKRGSLMNQSSAEAIPRPHLSAKTNEITIFEPLRKSINSYSIIQDEKQRNNFISVVDMNYSTKNKQIATTCTDKNRLLVEKRPLDSGSENITQPRCENTVKYVKGGNILDVDKSTVKKQSFIIVKSEKDNLNSNTVVCNQTALESKKRSCRYGLTIQEPIAEESDNADTTLKNNISDYQTEKGDNIKIKSFDENLFTEDIKKVHSSSIMQENCKVFKKDNSDSPKEEECKVFTAQLKKLETAFNYSTDLTYMKTSVSVQTDWSLIGITVDHFKQDQSSATCKTSVSSQTEITMNLLPTTKMASNILPIMRSPCIINSNHTEADKKSAKCELMCITSEDKTHNNGNDGKIINTLTSATADIEMNESNDKSRTITYSNFLPSNQTKSNYIYDVDFNSLTNLKNNEEEIGFEKLPKAKNTTLEQCQNCSISCFPSISEESIHSDMSGIDYEEILSSKIHSSLSEIHKKGILICYNINKEVIPINNCPNTMNNLENDKKLCLKSSPLFRKPANLETNQTRFKDENHMNVAHCLPLSLNNDSGVKSNIGLVSNSKTTIEIVTTYEETCSPITGTCTEYQWNTFQNNIFNSISTG